MSRVTIAAGALDEIEPDRAKAQIVLTDGEGAYSAALTQQAKDNGITIYTIGLGTSVDTALLQGIATATGGQYFGVAQAAVCQRPRVVGAGAVLGLGVAHDHEPARSRAGVLPH